MITKEEAYLMGLICGKGQILQKDKKSENNKIRLVLTRGYGKMFLKSFKNNAAITGLLKKYFSYIKTEENF